MTRPPFPDAQPSRAEAVGQRRLGTVLADDPTAAERLSRLDPVVRQVVQLCAGTGPAAGLTVADLAQMAGLPVDVVVAALAGEAVDAPAKEGVAEPLTSWLADFADAKAAAIDVRPMLERRQDPFEAVMTLADTVAVGGGLIIDAPFNPLPLRRVLEKRGFSSHAERMQPNHWRIRALRTAGVDQVDETGGDAAPVWPEADGVHIDVRGMTAPGPLVAILRLADGQDHDGRIVVHHDREPVYLFPELAERGWSWEMTAGKSGEVRLILTKDPR